MFMTSQKHAALKVWTLAMMGLTAWVTPVGLANTGDIEQILGMKTDRTGVFFQVQSHGCTGKDDFRVESEGRGGEVIQLTLKRMNPDQCVLKNPYGALIKFGYKELGLKDGMKFIVTNPLDLEPRVVAKPSAD
jgi:hypothetical protein